MGKRDRRRRRERAKGRPSTPPAAPPRLLFPGAGRPLVEVHVAADAPDDVKAMCRAYWEFDQPGTWAQPVASIGASTTQVYKAVRGVAHAALLTVLCPQCAAPLTVTSRSEMAATGHWAPDFPTDPVEARQACAECVAAAKEAARQEAARAKQQQQALDEVRVNNASSWVADQWHVAEADEAPGTLASLALLAVLGIMEQSGTETFGPLDKADYTLTGKRSSDVEVFQELFRKRWISPTLPATIGDFAFEDDDTVRGVYITQVPWRLAHWVGNGQAGRTRVSEILTPVLMVNAHLVREIRIDLEAHMGVQYLDGLLTNKYQEEPIPEHRLPDAYATARDALTEGFTLEQLVAIGWSAAAASVAWGQRTRGLSVGAVSSAAVTNLARRLGFAKDRPVPDYALPNWVARPAAHSTVLRFLERHDAMTEALSRFRALQQQVNGRTRDAEELDADLSDDYRAFNGLGEDDQFVEGLRERQQAERAREITYALVTVHGDLEFRTGTAADMRDSVSRSGSGFTDRIILEEARTLNVYVGELVPAVAENDNSVGVEMLNLLGSGEGPLFGTISFFAVAPSDMRPQGLDQEQQEMLRAAHQVVTARLGVSL